MPMVRISFQTERELYDWARDHYPYFASPKTIDEIIYDLIQIAKFMEQELKDRDGE